MNAETYLMNLKVKLAVSGSIQSVEIIDERIVLSDRGYFRARLVLANGDFLEISEYFVCEDEECFPKAYRYQSVDFHKIYGTKSSFLHLSLTRFMYLDFISSDKKLF